MPEVRFGSTKAKYTESVDTKIGITKKDLIEKLDSYAQNDSIQTVTYTGWKKEGRNLFGRGKRKLLCAGLTVR